MMGLNTIQQNTGLWGDGGMASGRARGAEAKFLMVAPTMMQWLFLQQISI